MSGWEEFPATPFMLYKLDKKRSFSKKGTKIVPFL